MSQIRTYCYCFVQTIRSRKARNVHCDQNAVCVTSFRSDNVVKIAIDCLWPDKFLSSIVYRCESITFIAKRWHFSPIKITIRCESNQLNWNQLRWIVKMKLFLSTSHECKHAIASGRSISLRWQEGSLCRRSFRTDSKKPNLSSNVETRSWRHSIEIAFSLLLNQSNSSID